MSHRLALIKFAGICRFFLFAILSISSRLFAQNENRGALHNIIQAKENFRLGVNAFNYGFYNRAVVAFEQALSFRPQDSDTILWLGRSYYANGYLGLGLEQWKQLIEQNQAKASLKSFYNTLDYRYRGAAEPPKPEPYSEFMKLQANKQGINRSVYFFGPSSARAAKDRDEIYVVDYLGNKVVALDINGSTKRLFYGSLTQNYQQPFGILLRPKGQGFILSQAGTNSLLFADEQGRPYKEAGSKGSGPAQFLGPQHLADSGDGYFYVSDWGNRRIAKLDYEGNFIFTFGAAQKERTVRNVRNSVGFPGFQGPTGLVVRGKKLYVADTLQRKIFVFNHDGQYLETLLSGSQLLRAPESLLLDQDRNLLIADVNQIKLYDFEQATLQTIYSGEKQHKYIGLDFDQNRNIFAVDLKNQEIHFITEKPNLYTDLFVRINRVVTSQYPEIEVDFTVEERGGNPIFGLVRENFRVFENNQFQPIKPFTSITDASVSLAVILGGDIQKYADAVVGLAQALSPEDQFFLIGGGRNPAVLAQNTEQLREQLASYTESAEPAESHFDVSLRFALDSMARMRRKKIIVFVSGKAGQIAAQKYNISAMKRYLRLQEATMYGLAGDNPLISYLAGSTGGRVYANTGRQFLAGFAKDIERHKTRPRNHYTLNYTSKAYTDLAKRYIPLEIFVRYVGRSGKDELGFFAPLSSVNAAR